MALDKYQVTEEQMINALREGIKATLINPEEECKEDATVIVEMLRDYKERHPDAEIFIETKYGILTQTFSNCDICSSNGENIVFVWK